MASDQLGPVEVCINMLRIKKNLCGVEWKVSHIYREGNKAADFLAGIGMQSGEQVFYSGSSVPARVKALCRLE